MKKGISKKTSSSSRQRNWSYRALSGVLAFLLMFSSVACQSGKLAHATTLTSLNNDTVFLKQPSGSKTCTLVSATMLLRRGAMLNGDSAWANITADTVSPIAWVTGTGLKWNFTYDGLKVAHASFDGSKTAMKEILASHPEGVVMYEKTSSKMHAILMTDYTDGVFYCADPAPGVDSGRIPVASASISIEDSSYIWYINSPALSLSATDTNDNSTDVVTTTVTSTAAPTVASNASSETTVTSSSTEAAAPKKVSGLSVKNSTKKSVMATWKEVDSAKGYQMSYSLRKDFEKKNDKIASGKKALLTGLSKGKTYYVKVRAYKLNHGSKIYGNYSKVKKAKVKK